MLQNDAGSIYDLYDATATCCFVASYVDFQQYNVMHCSHIY